MKEILVTVIIPIYKVENVLKRCIDSVLGQIYQNMEVILVNDGSPDDCGVICDEYASKDSRIRVIHKDNGGLSDARNAAIDIMRGEYVTFVDSDDYINNYYISHLVEAIQKDDSDMACSWFESVFEGEKPKSRPVAAIIDYSLNDRYGYLNKMLYQQVAESSAWGKLYKKDIFQNVRYPKGRLYEDIAVIHKVIEQCEKICVIGNVDYYYWQRKNSIMYQPFSEWQMDAVYFLNDLGSYINDNYPGLHKAFCCRHLSMSSNIICRIDDQDRYKSQVDFLWDGIKKDRMFVLMDREGRRKARIAACISFFGYKFYRFVYKKTQRRGK